MPGNKSLLSICALGYQHAPFIKDCIAHIWADPWQEKEIIALDDGSGDGSLEILKSLAEESPCAFRVIEQEHTGNVAANFNSLCKAASGDFVLFTSMDDMQIPGALTARMERLAADPACVFAAHTKDIQLLGDKQKPETTPMDALAGFSGNSRELAEKALELERHALHSFYIQGAVFRQSIVKKVGGFSENMIGDDIVLRTKIFLHMLKHPELTFALISEPGFIYRRHPHSASLNARRQILLVYQYYEKFWKGHPYPAAIRDLLMLCLDVLSYEEIMDIFSVAPGLATLLKDEYVRHGLKMNAVKSFVEEKEKETRQEEKTGCGE